MTDERPDLDIQVADDPDHLRYNVTVNGGPAGHLEYLLHGDRVVFTHAEVDPRWEGLGVGSRLAKVALDDVVARGKQITPLCPFIVDYIHRHLEYVESVDEVHRGEFSTDDPNRR
jgi:uncharacterized protein